MSSVETLMPNVAAARSSHATRAQLEEYYRQQATKKKVLTPLLKTVQGRRTGLVIDQAVRKDSEGFDDLDAFWAITPADDSTLSSLSPPRRRRRSTAVSSRVSSESSLELRLTDTPVASAFTSLEGGRRSSLALVLTETPTATHEPDETREQSPHPEKATQSEQEDVEVTEERLVDPLKKKEDKAKPVPGDQEAEPASGAPPPSNHSSAVLDTTHAAVVLNAVAVEVAHPLPAHAEEPPEEEVDKTQEDDDDPEEEVEELDSTARRLSFVTRDDTDGAVGVSESKEEEDTPAEKRPSHAPTASEPAAASSGGNGALAEQPSDTAVPAAAAAFAAVIAETNSGSVDGASAYEASDAASGSAGGGGGGGEAVTDDNGKKKKKTKGAEAGEDKRDEGDAGATRRKSSCLHRGNDAATADGTTTTPPESDDGAASMLLRLDHQGDGVARGGERVEVEKGRDGKGEGDVATRGDAGGERKGVLTEARDVEKKPSSVGATEKQQEQQQRGNKGKTQKGAAAGAADAEAQQRVKKQPDAGKEDAVQSSPIKAPPLAPPASPKPRISSPTPKKSPSPTASAIADDQDWSKGADDTLDFSDHDGGDYGGNDYGGGYDYEEPASLAEQQRDADARRKDSPPSSSSAKGRRKKGASTTSRDGKKASSSLSNKKVKAIAPPDVPPSPLGQARTESSSSAKKRKVVIQEEEGDDDDDGQRVERKKDEGKQKAVAADGTDKRRREKVKHDLINEEGVGLGDHGGGTHQTRASRRGGVVDLDADTSPFMGGGVVDEEPEEGEQEEEDEEEESLQTAGGKKRKKPAAAATKKTKGKGAKAEKKKSKDKGKPKANAKIPAAAAAAATTTSSSSAAMDVDDVDHDTDPGMFEGDVDEQPNGLHTVPRGDGWHAPGIRPARMSEVARRHKRGKDQIVGGSSSRVGDVDEGEGAMGTRYPVRRRVGPLAYWKNERIHHVLRPLTDAVVDVDTEHLTREAKELLKLEVPDVKEVLLAEKTPARPSRRPAKRKATGGGGGPSHAAKKKRRAEDHGPGYSLDQARADHPERLYTSRRKILCWDHTKNEVVKMRVASYREEQNIGPLVEGDGKAKHKTPVVHAGSFFSRFQAPGDKRVGYVAGACVLPPGSVKPIESIGECQQVFWVADAEDKCLEVTYANQHTDDVDDPNAGIRLLYSAGDCFIVPSYNFYGLQNLSETTDAKINWIIIKPHMENGDLVSNAEDDEERAAVEGHTQEEAGEEGGEGVEGQGEEEDDANTVAQDGDDEGGDDDDDGEGEDMDG